MSQFAVQSITLSINNSAPQYEMRNKSYKAHYKQITHKKLGLCYEMRFEIQFPWHWKGFVSCTSQISLQIHLSQMHIEIEKNIHIWRSLLMQEMIYGKYLSVMCGHCFTIIKCLLHCNCTFCINQIKIYPAVNRSKYVSYLDNNKIE